MCADHGLLLGLGWGGDGMEKGRHDMGMEWNGTEVNLSFVVACLHSLMQKNAACCTSIVHVWQWVETHGFVV